MKQRENGVVCMVGGNANRDQIVVSLPKSQTRKDFDALQHTIQRAAWKALTSRRRRKGK